MEDNSVSIDNEKKGYEPCRGFLKGSELVEDELGEIYRYTLQGTDATIYWGTAITSFPSFAYMVPLKILARLSEKINVIILLADLHGILDGTPTHQVNERMFQYHTVISLMLISLGANMSNVKFVNGSSFQKSERYITDLFRLTNICSINRARHASSEVVKKGEKGEEKMSSTLYPLMQVLDEIHLGVQIELGGVDQRKIFMLSRELLPKIGHAKTCYILNPLLPSLSGKGKMSSSDPKSKINMYDTREEISPKIMKCFTPDIPKDLEGVSNKVDFVTQLDMKIVLLKWCDILDIDSTKYKTGHETPQQFKTKIINHIDSMVEPVRKAIVKEDILKTFQ